LVTAKGSGLAVTPAALTGKTVGTLSGTAVSSFIKTQWSDTDRREYPSWDEAWIDLTAGRIDAILGYKSQLVTTYLSKPENAAAYEIVGNLEDPSFQAPEFAVVFNKDKHPFLPKVDEALASLRADGTFDQVIKKYFPDEQK
ncbi:MAG TPA: transporter substrate-binding domain-containing protein, partial [Nordella sp.]|nr:transporter substrate-binding domain-containing protein [Nordella sp.]